MTWHLDRIRQSGTKRWCHLTADERRELEAAARKLREPIKDSPWPHLDLDEKKREAALRLGAEEEE